MTGWSKAWIAWAVASAVSFAGIEARALKVPHASLSEHLRTVFGFDGFGPLPRTRRSIFYAAWGWLGLHILRETAGCVSSVTPPIPPL